MIQAACKRIRQTFHSVRNPLAIEGTGGLVSRRQYDPSTKDETVFYDPAQFGFSKILEQHTAEIAEEFAAVEQETVDWMEKDLYGEGWEVFGIYNFPYGQPLADGVRRCPITAELVARNVPGHGAAGFSVLKPGTNIKPHVGYQGDFLRLHLGLIVPEGDCGLSVRGKRTRWQNGRAMIFDDREPHSAWNNTEQDRVVLLVDFVPDPNLELVPVPDGHERDGEV